MRSEETFDASTDATTIQQVFDAARAIPLGRVISYGALGARCDPPISGYICGRIMNGAVNDVPWWRVVAKDGSLSIAKRNPRLAQEQRERLQTECVEFDAEGRVLMGTFSVQQSSIPDDSS